MGTFGKRKSTDMHVTKDEVSELKGKCAMIDS